MDNFVASSVVVTANDTDVKTTAGEVFSITVESAAADANITIKNGSTGTLLWAGTARNGQNSIHASFPAGLKCPAGIRIGLAGGGARATVTYR